MTNLSNLTDLNRFRTLALLTVLIIYLLILAGGIVRGTGSGMGCPDWPRCFGQWVPPTHLSQLPPNYKEIYGAKLKGEVEFNATKTWIEYVNRLLGVLSGFFVFATLLASSFLYKFDRNLFWGSLSAFLLIGANGWLGSKVVSTELAPYLITTHLILAILVVFSLLYVWLRSGSFNWKREAITNGNWEKQIRIVAISVIVITFIQLVLGTEVRDKLDVVVRQLGYGQRDNWVSQLNWTFYVHRSFSIVVLIGSVYLVYIIRKVHKYDLIRQMSEWVVAVVLIEIAMGAVMGYFAVPAFAQPIHILLAVVLIGIQFGIVLLTSPKLLRIRKQSMYLQSS